MPHLFMYCIMHHASFIYVLYYAPCIIYLCIVLCTMHHLFMYCIMSHVFILSLVPTHFLTPGRVENQYPLLEEEYEKDHQARYIEEGQVT
jgi:hypothetical protein